MKAVELGLERLQRIAALTEFQMRLTTTITIIMLDDLFKPKMWRQDHEVRLSVHVYAPACIHPKSSRGASGQL
jgi:hypothetical protein